jgi:arginyl-tRNA synthetase
MPMDLYLDFENRIRNALQVVGIEAETDTIKSLLSRVVVEAPRDPSHGDIATNAALVLAKPLGKKPRDIAVRLALELEADRDIAAAEVAGPGFINLRLSDACWADVLAGILAAGDEYGHQPNSGAAPVNVEYVSANPTGPMHIGHCRGAVVGDAIANMLAATGNPVTREYYINDAGAQIDVLAQSALLRYREALGETIGDIPSGYYPGDYLKPVGEALKAEFGDTLLAMSETEMLSNVRERTIDAMMTMIRDDLARINIRHDVFSSERAMTTGGKNRIADAIETLSEKGLIYEGKLPPPKGKQPEDWEDREQTLFKSSQFGDDMDRPLLKSDGSYTYFASDIAYHYDKFQRGFTRMIDVLGADHAGYGKRMKAAVMAISDGEAELEVQFCQLVKLFRGGEPVQMSKRSGDFVTLREVVDEVGADAVRFMMLYRKADAPLDFDFKVVTEQSKDNPVFYVQYAHARTESVRRQASAVLGQADLATLSDEGERMLVRQMAEWPRILDGAARSREPHRVAFYLNDLASTFHAHWNRGKELPQLRFIRPDNLETSRARLALVTATGNVLRSGLSVLGVDAPREMR